jgi:hypothetical protein
MSKAITVTLTADEAQALIEMMGEQQLDETLESVLGKLIEAAAPAGVGGVRGCTRGDIE